MGTFELARITTSIIMGAGVDSVVSFPLFLSKKVKHVDLELKQAPEVL